MRKTLLLFALMLVSQVSFSQADIVVINSDYSSTYIPGENSVYQLTVANLGPQTATNVVVNLPIPANISFFTWQGSNGSFGEFIPLSNTIASLPSGQMVTYIITMEIPGSYTGNLVSTATVTSSTADPNPGCPDCTDTNTKAVGADIELVNTNNQTAYVPGSTVTYTVSVSNNGPLTAANIQVNNAIPAGITQFSWFGNGDSGTDVPLDNVITSLPAGEEVDYTITIQVPISFTGNLVSSASFSTPTVDPVPGCPACVDTDILFVPVVPPIEADVVTTITDGALNYTPGTSQVYTLTVTNNGPDAATNVNVTAAIPAGITQFSWTGSNGSSGTNVAVNNTIPTLADGQTVTYTITIQIPITFTGPLTINAASSSPTTDPVPGCTTCSDTDSSVTIADIVVTNTNNQSAYVAGSTVVYDITVTNNGPHSAQNVQVTNAIPAGITQFSWTGSNGSSGTNTALNNTIPTLTNGQVITYTITIVIPVAQAGNLTSTTVVTSSTTDQNPACAACVDTDTKALTGADIVVVNTNNQNSYTAGTSAVYTVTVTNNGPQTAINVNVSNPIPAGITAFSWTGSNGSSGTNVNLNNTIASMPAGTTVTYTINVNIPVGFTGPLTSTTSISSPTSDPNPGCLQCTDTDLAEAANIVVTNTNNQTIYFQDTTVIYTVTVTNNGPTPADNVVVTNAIPAGISLFSWSGTNGSSGVNTALSNTIPMLAVGQTVTYTITLEVPVGYTPNLVSQTNVTSDTTDPSPGCPACTDTDVLQIAADIYTNISDGSATFTPGTTSVYNFTVSNFGPNTANNVNINYALPAGLTAADVSWTGPGGPGTGAINANIPNMPSGASQVYTITVVVPADFSQTDNIVSNVTVTSPTFDQNPGCDTCSDVNTPNASANLVVQKTNGQTQFLNSSTRENEDGTITILEEHTTYSITIANQGPSDAFNVSVIDALPAGITEMTWLGITGESGEGALNQIIPVIPAGQTYTYLVTIMIPLNYDLSHPTLVNTVVVDAETPDPVPACPGCSDVDTPKVNYVTVQPPGTYTGQQLVENILIHSDCAGVSNFSMIGANSNGISAFHRNNSDFPLKEGIVISSGNVSIVAGPFDGTGGTSSNGAGGSDAQLQAISTAQGQGGTVSDTHGITFTFTPLTDEFSFKFLFASAEYGPFQCFFSDVFAFILTDVTAGTPYTNIAKIPGTTIPVAVTTIRDNAYNGGCPSANVAWFDRFNPDDPGNAAINQRGQALPMIASATVIPNHTYTIKLVIGDYSDTALDSSVWIEAGSFNVGQPKITGATTEFEGLEDFTLANGAALCAESTREVRAGSQPIAGATYTWYYNDTEIVGANSYLLTVNQSGIYKVVITIGGAGGCAQSDEIIVEFLPPVPFDGDPVDLTNGCPVFNLHDNDEIIIGTTDPDFYSINYHNTLADAQNVGAVIVNSAAYTPAADGETIYVSIQDLLTNCVIVRQFQLFFAVEANTPPDLVECVLAGNTPSFDLTPQVAAALGSNSAANFTVSFHNSEQDAKDDVSAITPLTSYAGTDGEVVFVRMESNANPNSYCVKFFTLFVNLQPATPASVTISQCDDYTLPVLPAGSTYHSASGGLSTTIINAGTVLTASQIVYIFAQTSSPSNTVICSAEGTLTYNAGAPIDISYDDVTMCDQYQLPLLPANQSYHSATGGASTTIINAGTTITSSQQIFVYYELDDCIDEDSFQVTINITPNPPTVTNVTNCGPYALPALPANQTYWTGAYGTSAQVFPAFSVTTTTTFNVYEATGTTPNCVSTASPLTITIVPIPVAPVYPNVIACDSYPLPNDTPGTTFHTQPNGVGPVTPGGTVVTATTTFYVYSQSGTTPNCTDESSFTVTINSTPSAPTVVNVTNCGPYALPALPANQTYWTGAYGTSTQVFANFSVTSTTTFNVFEETGTTPNCVSTASPLTITIVPIPVAPVYPNVIACDSYPLPNDTPGTTFHTQPNGVGPVTPGGTVVTATTTFYVYSQSGTTPNCTDESSFTVTINSTPSAPTVVNVTNCGPYALPALPANQTYWTGAYGTSTQVFPAFSVPTTTTFNVYEATGTTPNCVSTASPLTITIVPIPVAPVYPNVIACDSYPLPNDTPGTTFHTQPNGVGPVTPGGTVVTATTTFYVYSQSGTTPNCTDESSFTVTINNTPNPPSVVNVTNCGPYALPALPANQTYWTGAYGTSTQVFANFSVTSTTTFNVFEETGTTPNCVSTPSPLTITIVPIPVAPVYPNVIACDSYPLPADTAGTTFHTQSNGVGPVTPGGTVVTATTTFYVYSQSGTTPNCTDESSFTVTINNTPVLPAFADQVVCDVYILPALPANSTYHTQADGLGTQLQELSPVTVTQTIYVYAQTGTTPNCIDQDSFVVTVNQTPTVDDLADVVVCDSYTLPVLLIGGSYSSGPNGGGTPYAAGDVITTSMTMYIYDDTNTNPNCSAQSSFDITVNQTPVIVTPTPFALCDDNADGVACFDLTTKNNEITNIQTGLVVTYHETATDAANGTNAVNASNYCNNGGPGMQTIHIRVAPAGAPQCAATTSMTLIVNPRPVVPATVADFAKCDYTGAAGVEQFDLTQINSVLLNGQTNVAVTYYDNQADAQSGTNPITNPTNYTNTTSPQQICARLQNTNTQCFSVVCFNIRVNALPVINDPAPMQMCNDGITNVAAFDLAGNDAFITNNTAGLQVTYHLSQGDANNEVGALASPYTSGPTTLFVRVENESTNCFVTTTITLIVNQGPVALDPTPLQVCDPNNDGFAGFDLQSKNVEISGGNPQAGVTITYHETPEDAQNGVNTLPLNGAPLYTNTDPWLQTVYVRVAFDFTGCTAFTELQLIVNPTPEANEAATPLEVCDDNADGLACFTLANATTNILNGLDPAAHTVTYHATQANAQNDTNPIQSSCYTNSNPGTQTIWVRVEHNTNGCFDVVPLQLIVNPLPVVAFPIPSYTLCDVNPGSQSEVFDLASQIPSIAGAGMEVTFHFTAAQAEAGTNDLPLSYTAGPVQTIHVRVTNTDTGCYETSTMDLRVEPLPAPVIPLPGDPLLNLCDLDGNGFATFNLQGLILPMQQGTTSFSVTFYETQANADNGVDPIGNPSAYPNNLAYTQTIWVRAQNNGAPGCRVVFPIVLNVVASPVIAQDSLDDLNQCDTDSNNQNGVSVFDLTVQNPVILAQQSGPASSYMISYYTDPNNAAMGTGRILNPQNHTNSPAFSQPIWVRVEDASSECVNIASFTITVDIPMALTAPASYTLCDDNQNDNNTPSATFDLTIRDSEINGGEPSYTVQYFLTEADQLANTGAIQNPSAFVSTQNATTIYVAVTSPVAGCRSFTTMTIRVIPLPTPNADLSDRVIEMCDDNSDGQEVFDLTQNQSYIANNDPSLSFQYFLSQADANVPQNAIANPAAHLSGDDTIYIRVNKIPDTDIDGNNCYVIVAQEIVVNRIPIINTPVVLQGCDDDNNGTAIFNLQQQANPLVIDNTPQTEDEFTFTYHASAAAAASGSAPLPNIYESLPATIYVRVVNIETGCINATGEITLVVNAGASATAYDPDTNPSPMIQCADAGSANNDTSTFDLTTMDAYILGSQLPANYTVTYYSTAANAVDNITIADPSQYVSPTGFVWATVTNNATGCRSTAIVIPVTVEPLPMATITSSTGGNTICVEWETDIFLSGLTLNSSITDTDDYTYQWYLDGVALTGEVLPSHTIDENLPGTYSLEVISTTAQLCGFIREFEVIRSGPAVVEAASAPGWTISNPFEDVQTLTITVAGYGNYQYALDYGPFMDNGGVFTNVGTGKHFVTVRDFNNTTCGDLIIDDIEAINYPHYFSPNGDGINDTWNIFSLANDASAKIYIFDRYGKLIKQISPQGAGWDGTFSGQLLPSDDYWFRVTYTDTAQNAKEFRAHFSLKR